MLTWSDNWIIGHDEIDAGHKRFFDLVDAMETALVAGEERSTVQAIAVALAIDTAAHFSAEERLLAAHGYPGAEEHRARHQEILRTVDAALIRCDDADEEEVWLAACKEVKTVLLNHLVHDDMAYRQFLVEQGIVGVSEES